MNALEFTTIYPVVKRVINNASWISLAVQWVSRGHASIPGPGRFHTLQSN